MFTSVNRQIDIDGDGCLERSEFTEILMLLAVVSADQRANSDGPIVSDELWDLLTDLDNPDAITEQHHNHNFWRDYVKIRIFPSYFVIHILILMIFVIDARQKNI